jgi:polyhydroxyalkanoate synthesis regulator phasin
MKAPLTERMQPEKTGTVNRKISIANGVIKTGELTVEEVQTITKDMTDALDALDYACNHIKRGTLDFVDTDIPRLIREMRTIRMAMSSEMSALTTQLADLRKFFHGESYEQEVARLREFADLCERLQKLKDSGFLDQIADTMIKLS